MLEKVFISNRVNLSVKRVSVKADDVINDLVQWIDNNLDKPLRVKDVAARSGYSQWYLQRVFRRLMHVSVAEYIRQKKMALVAKELQASNESLIRIISRYGYESQQVFTRTFTNMYNISPGRYRHQLNNS